MAGADTRVAERAIKVCFVTERFPPQGGGVAVAARRLVGFLAEESYAVHVVHPCPTPGREFAVEQLVEDGVHVHRIHYSAWDRPNLVAFLKFLYALHQENRFDIFHGFWLSMARHCSFITERAQDRPPKPVIVSMRGSDALTLIMYPWWRDEIREGLQQASWITSVNQHYLDHVRRELDIRTPGSVIRNSVAAVAEEDTWRLDEGNRGVVGTVGLFRIFKDIPLLIRGYAAVPAHVRSRLLLAGRFEDDAADEEEWSNTLIQEFGIRDEVQLTGPFAHEAVGRHLCSMHVYVQSSAYEGLPNALLEAAAHGVPIVATAVGGMQEILTHGENALMVPHGDPTALTAAMERVLREPALAAALSRGGRKLAAEFSQARERQQWIDLYRRLT